MNVTRDDIGTDRFDLALDLLAEGRSFALSGVSFFLEEPDVVRCNAWTDWQPENLDETRAQHEIVRAQEAFSLLSNRSPRFASLVQGRSPRYSVGYDYGTGGVELYYLSGDKLMKS